jgi:hypothetical protein
MERSRGEVDSGTTDLALNKRHQADFGRDACRL